MKPCHLNQISEKLDCARVSMAELVLPANFFLKLNVTSVSLIMFGNLIAFLCDEGVCQQNFQKILEVFICCEMIRDCCQLYTAPHRSGHQNL